MHNDTDAGPDRLLDILHSRRRLEREEFARLIAGAGPALRERAAELARAETLARFGDRIYMRGLIEFSSHCRNDCLYCGIRRGNARAQRYRLSREEILDCCRVGHDLGFRTFVLQGGEDSHYNDDRLAGIVSAVHRAFPDCAITLSGGERSRESYLRLFRAGATRYLLRHETANADHYARLHPPGLTLENRRRCLRDLKEIGYQTGCGFMVGSPFQTAEHLADDLRLLMELQPEMVGIGPFIPHHDTPFAGEPPGDVGATLFMISLARLILPRALIPATTALGTMATDGRERGVLAGANVVMPNLSPGWARSKYLLYDNKLHGAAEAAENRDELAARMAAIGRRVVVDRGDYSYPDE